MSGDLVEPVPEMPPEEQLVMLLELLDNPEQADEMLAKRAREGVVHRQTTFGDPDAVVWDPRDNNGRRRF